MADFDYCLLVDFSFSHKIGVERAQAAEGSPPLRMSDDKEEFTFSFSLNVMINKERSRVLFAEADNHFADILLSFLTFPLGRIFKILEKHYGDEAPAIGSLSSLYRSLANLDSSHFVTDGAKQILLNPISSFDDEIKGLKLDISDSPPAEYFYCTLGNHNEFRIVSIYYDELRLLSCNKCFGSMKKKIVPKSSEAASSDGVFAIHKDSFIISDDLQIFPNEMGISGIVTIVGIADMDKAELIKVDLGFNEIMNLLKASLTSPTPLSHLILNKTRQMNSSTVESQPKISLPHLAEEEKANSRALSLKVIIQESTGKFLYAQAKEDFVEFLFSFLHIPLGGAEHLLQGKTSVKAIDNLYRSTTDLIDCKYFKAMDTKKRLMKPNLPHGCISEECILPLTEEALPSYYKEFPFYSSKFPNGHGRYLRGLRTYQVKDDLTVLPFCIVSILSSLREKKISISDAKEMELQIGLKEACSILKASLTSTTALTDALLTHKSIKQPKREEV